jgi:glucosamine-phosphate N-acetyltransferase
MEIDNLKLSDLVNGFLETLNSLRPTNMTPEDAAYLFWQLNTRSNIFVAREGHQVVGAATLIIEQKFIHQGAKVAHIEDVAVHKDHQGKGIGQELIKKMTDYAKHTGCYKIILDCNPELIPFYEKCGFQQSAVQMRKDLCE